MNKVLYDAEREKIEFEKKIAKFEKKLTKANQRGRLKKKGKLEWRVSRLIDKRMARLICFEFNRGGGECGRSFNYSENGETRINVKFEKYPVSIINGDEIIRPEEMEEKRTLLNKPTQEQNHEQNEVVEKPRESGFEVIIPANKGSKVGEKHVCGAANGTCSYDLPDACGCDSYCKDF